MPIYRALALCIMLVMHLCWPHGVLAQEKLIVVFGDSLSSGYKISSERSWPSLLERRLQETGIPLRVINASKKGETTEGGRNRLPQILNKYNPSLVILALGANDGILRQSPFDMKANLNEMVSMVRASGGKPILVGMKLPPFIDPAYADDFSSAFAQAAAQTGTPFVPFLLEEIVDNPSLFFLSDRRHPNEIAQPHLLDVVWPVLSTVIASQ